MQGYFVRICSLILRDASLKALGPTRMKKMLGFSNFFKSFLFLQRPCSA